MSELEERVSEALRKKDDEVNATWSTTWEGVAAVAVGAVLDALSSGPLHERMIEEGARVLAGIRFPADRCGEESVVLVTSLEMRSAFDSALAVARSQSGGVL